MGSPLSPRLRLTLSVFRVRMRYGRVMRRAAKFLSSRSSLVIREYQAMSMFGMPLQLTPEMEQAASQMLDSLGPAMFSPSPQSLDKPLTDGRTPLVGRLLTCLAEFRNQPEVQADPKTLFALGMMQTWVRNMPDGEVEKYTKMLHQLITLVVDG